MILGDRKYVEISGEKTHELPPLLLCRRHKNSHATLLMAKRIVATEDMIPPSAETHKVKSGREMDLALNLAEQYQSLADQWRWGDSVLEWIKQCETTFSTKQELRNILRADLWPHAGRQSFVELLSDKHVATDEVELPKAIGLRLTFRQLPPIVCFSDQFLLYLNRRLLPTAYITWAENDSNPVSSLPPERFNFQVLETSLDF